MTDEEMSQREKRRQQFEHTKPKVGVTAAGLKKWAWPLGLVLLVGGIVTAMVVTDNAAGDCPGHWHGAFTVIVDGQEVPFNLAQNPQWGSVDNTWAPGTHIHQDQFNKPFSDGIYHFHPAAPRCTPWEDALRHLNIEVSSSKLTLGAEHGALAGTYEEAPVRVFKQAWSAQDDEWVEVSKFSSVLNKQPLNGDGLVILYGDYTDAQVEEYLANANTMKGNPSYDPHFEAA